MFFRDFNNILNKSILTTLTIIFISVMMCLSYLHYKEKQNIVVAKVICAEACSEGNLIMFGVGSTIQNRMTQYNKTAYEIVTEKNQYYGYTNINKNKIFEDKQCRETSLYLAKNIKNLIDITNGALYFRMENESIKEWHNILTIKIGRIYFYK